MSLSCAVEECVLPADHEGDCVLREGVAVRADHLLHIDGIEEEGYPEWRFTCEHSPDDRRWWCTNPDGSFVEPAGVDGCWFESWWGAIGSELIGRVKGPVTFPLPVRPSDGWDYEEGGSIVAERAA